MKIRSLLILLLSMWIAPLILAQQTPQSLADAELPSLLGIYKDIHSHPELSGHEERTAALVAKELRAAGCEVTEHLGKYENSKLKAYGVVGVMKNGDGPTVLVRTDMDALPVEEETGLPYASKVVAKNDEGKDVHVMHACGHDTHIAAFIGTARALGKLKDQWHGTIVFVAQPAEEIGTGARALLNDGLYDRFGKPNFALGFHDKADLASRPHRRHRRLHVRKCRFSRCHRARRGRTRRVSAQDQGPDRPRSGNHQRAGKPSQAAKIIRSIRLLSRWAPFTAEPSTTSFRTK